MSGLAHLSIEGVVMEEVGAVELLAVGLHHGDPVLPPLEYLHLVHREDVGPGEVSLSVDVDCAIEHIQTDHLIEVRVLVRKCGSFSMTIQLYTLNIMNGIQISRSSSLDKTLRALLVLRF